MHGIHKIICGVDRLPIAVGSLRGWPLGWHDYLSRHVLPSTPIVVSNWTLLLRSPFERSLWWLASDRPGRDQVWRV